MADKTEQKTKAQKAIEMKAKLAALEEEAKNELLEGVNQMLKDLQELGFVYHLLSDADLTARQTQNLPSGKLKTQKTAKDPSAPKKPCKQCGSLEHDARFHRAENLARKKAEQTKA